MLLGFGFLFQVMRVAVFSDSSRGIIPVLQDFDSSLFELFQIPQFDKRLRSVVKSYDRKTTEG
jgi:hypothetical protein